MVQVRLCDRGWAAPDEKEHRLARPSIGRMLSQKAFSFGRYQGGLGDAKHQFIGAASQGRRGGVGLNAQSRIDQLQVQLIDLLLELHCRIGQIRSSGRSLLQESACSVGKSKSEHAG